MTDTGDSPTLPFPTDATGASTASTAAPAEAQAPVVDTAERRRHSARIGTIIWGFLVAAVAAVVALTTNLVQIEDPTAWLIGGLVVGGAALVVAGIAAAVRRAD